jgi:hypothetical protein
MNVTANPILFRRQSVCALARDFLQEQDFPGRNLLQRASRTPEELLSGANFLRRLLQRVRSPERSAPAYGTVLLAPCWSNLLRVKPFLPNVVSSHEIALREILLLEESWAKAHTDWRHFKKFFMKTIL